MIANLANRLTIFRIVLIPVFAVFFYLPGWVANLLALSAFVLAMLTDLFDGLVARKFNQVSSFGAFLDPVADKLLITTALVLLLDKFSHWHIIFMLPVLVIILREITVSAMREWMSEIGQRSVIAVSSLGKVKTTMQFSAILVLINDQTFGFVALEILHLIGLVCLYIAAILTLWSMVLYLKAFFEHQQ